MEYNAFYHAYQYLGSPAHAKKKIRVSSAQKRNFRVSAKNNPIFRTSQKKVCTAVIFVRMAVQLDLFFREDPSTFCVLPYAKMWFWASRVTHSYTGLEACHWVSLCGGPLRNANRGEFPALAPKKKAQKKVSSLPLRRAALRKRKDSSEKN